MIRGLLILAKKIIIDLNFAGINHLYVAGDQNITPIRFGAIEDMEFSLMDILNKHPDINDIILTGQKDYAQGFKKEILNNVISKYANRNVRVYINDKIFN